jgi:histidine triad (HIT) family protein
MQREQVDPEYAATIFARTARGEAPCHKVYEDAHVIAFLDTGAIAPGHTLVVPKEHAVTMGALSDASAAALGRVLPRLCRAIAHATGCPDSNIVQNNGRAASQTVMHVHLHIIPKPSETTGLQITPSERRFDDAEGEAMARRIREAV